MGLQGRLARGCGSERASCLKESSAAANERRAVEDLGVRRVQHGRSALGDLAVMPLLSDHEVTLDMMPISNVKLRGVPSMREHLIKKFGNYVRS